MPGTSGEKAEPSEGPARSSGVGEPLSTMESETTAVRPLELAAIAFQLSAQKEEIAIKCDCLTLKG